MKKLLALLLSISMLIMCAPGFSLVASAAITIDNLGGTGTFADPYQISTEAEFLAVFANGGELNGYVSTNSSSAPKKGKYIFFEQQNDITLTTYQPSTANMRSNYDGNGYSITITSYTPTNSKDGLFPVLLGTVRNLTIEKGATITGETYVGAFTGYCNSGKVINCVNKTDVSASSNYLGGIAGALHKGSAINCINTGKVTSTSANLGGIAGYVSNTGAVISYCANYGEVSTNYNTTDHTGIGGILGKASKNATIEKSFNAGAVKSREDTTMVTAGIIGDITSSAVVTVSDCFNTGVLSNAGGTLLGTLTSGTMTATNFYDIANDGIGFGTTVSGATTADADYYQSSDLYTFATPGYEYPNFAQEDRTFDDAYTGQDFSYTNVSYVLPEIVSGASQIFLSSEGTDGITFEDVTTGYAIVNGKFTASYLVNNVQYGVCISKDVSGEDLTKDTATQVAYGNKAITNNAGVTTYGILIYGENMVPGDTYYVRPFIKYQGNYYYGNPGNFVLPSAE